MTTKKPFVAFLGITLEHRLLDFFIENKGKEIDLKYLQENGFKDAFNGSGKAPRLKRCLYRWWKMGILSGYDLDNFGAEGIDTIKFTLNVEDNRVQSLIDFANGQNIYID